MDLRKLFSWLSPSKPVGELEPLGMVDPAVADAAVLDQMVKHGADLTQARDTRFFIYLETKEGAEAVAETLRTQGFAIEPITQYGAGAATWLVLASKTMLVNRESITELREMATALASANGGGFDGWEAAL